MSPEMAIRSSWPLIVNRCSATFLSLAPLWPRPRADDVDVGVDPDRRHLAARLQASGTVVGRARSRRRPATPAATRALRLRGRRRAEEQLAQVADEHRERGRGVAVRARPI